MNINDQIIKWQATFILVAQSNETFCQKQERIREVAKEVTVNLKSFRKYDNRKYKTINP